mmetsp:Transcript_3647/g.7743  ORF Transcript_3647/g.7743 Transcript_3647/m.7743 type:complete len:431 (-) Transcript_3647:817-2109(-)
MHSAVGRTFSLMTFQAVLATSITIPQEILAHVDNLTAPGVPSLLRWWCGYEGHAAGPLCVRHEISLQMHKSFGMERRQQKQHRQSLLGDGAAQELKRALVAYCAERGSTNSTLCSGDKPATNGRASVRATQLVAMNEWWCGQDGHASSLGCARHRLQQQYLRVTPVEREAVHEKLVSTMANAKQEELDKLHEDSQKMQQLYCALPSSRDLEICAQPPYSAHTRNRAKKGRGSKGSKRSSSRGQSGRGGSKRGTSKGGRSRKGTAPMWSPQALRELKRWWCTEHAPKDDSRCAAELVWTRSLASASGLRNYFCLHGNSSSAAAWTLCKSASEPQAVARGQLAAARPMRPLLRPLGVLKLMLALLCISVFVGWKLRGQIGGKTVVIAAAPNAEVGVVGEHALTRRRVCKRKTTWSSISKDNGSGINLATHGS